MRKRGEGNVAGRALGGGKGIEREGEGDTKRDSKRKLSAVNSKNDKD